jgi:hypothetical protein
MKAELDILRDRLREKNRWGSYICDVWHACTDFLVSSPLHWVLIGSCDCEIVLSDSRQ